MKLREIIKLACVILQLDELLNSEYLFDENYDILDEQSILTSGTSTEKTLNLLIKCFNLAYSEIATDYLPLITMQNVTVYDGVYNLNALDNNFYKLIKLENKNGESSSFKIVDNILYAKNGDYQLYYCYIPNALTLNSDVSNFNGRVYDRIFVYGLVKEFYCINGLYEEAKFFQTKFEESIKNSKVVKKEIKLPKRRWL